MNTRFLSLVSRQLSHALLGCVLACPLAASAQQANAIPAASPAQPQANARAPIHGKSATLITDKGIGVAKIGMPLSVLRNKLQGAAFQEVSGVYGDVDAIAVVLNSETLFLLLHLAGSELTRVEDLVTNNPRFCTQEGLRAGMTLEEAEKTCGKATLHYSSNHETLEFVSFENQPFPNIKIRTKSPDGGRAGVYAPETEPSPAPKPSPETDAPETSENQIEIRTFQTEKFKPGSTIESITVTSPWGPE